MANRDDASGAADGAGRAPRRAVPAPMPDGRRDAADDRTASLQQGVRTALVTDATDPQGRGRIGISMRVGKGPDRRMMARLATLHAGPDRGTWFIPEVGDEVLVAFEDGDVDRPVVLGSLWGAGAAPPVPDGHDGGNDVKLFRSRAGTQLAFDDSSTTRIELRTAGGTRIVLTEHDDEVVIQDTSGNTITMGAAGIAVESSATVTVSAAQVDVAAGAVSVDSGMATFSGVVKADTVITNSVVSSSYTPGAGNVW